MQTTTTSGTQTGADDGLARFNGLPSQVAAALLRACCAAPSFVDGVLASRPYADRAGIEATAGQLAGHLDNPGLDAALAAHPRIGDRASGTDTEDRWSRSEQGSVSRNAHTASRLAAANRDYERRFGRVFLICAAGLSGEQVLTALTERMGNDAESERRVVREELRKIALLRLARALDELDEMGKDTAEGAAR